MQNILKAVNFIDQNLFYETIYAKNFAVMKSDVPSTRTEHLIAINFGDYTLAGIYKYYIDSVRRISGDYPESNKILEDVFFTDCQYIDLIKLTLDEVNLTPPITKKITIKEAYGKIDNVIIYGTLAHAYARLADMAGRNVIPWQGGELAINLDKSPHFDKWFEVYNAKYTHFLSEYKRQANIDSGWGSYSGWGWFW